MPVRGQASNTRSPAGKNLYLVCVPIRMDRCSSALTRVARHPPALSNEPFRKAAPAIGERNESVA